MFARFSVSGPACSPALACYTATMQTHAQPLTLHEAATLSTLGPDELAIVQLRASSHDRLGPRALCRRLQWSGVRVERALTRIRNWCNYPRVSPG